MFGFIRDLGGRIFGSTKTIERVVSSVTNGLNTLSYTEQEKAEDARAERKEARGMLIDWMAETKGQNLARRTLAFMIVGVWLGLFVTAAIMSVVGVWAGVAWVTAATLLFSHASDIAWAITIIIGFYFAAPALPKMVDKAMSMIPGKRGKNEK